MISLATVDYIQENNIKQYTFIKPRSIDDPSFQLDLFTKDSEMQSIGSMSQKESNLMTNNIIENYTNNISGSKLDILDFRVEIPKVSLQDDINNQKTVTFLDIKVE